MKVFLKWASLYLASLLLVTILGYQNHSNNVLRDQLITKENALKGDLIKTSKLHFELLSPLALQQWAKQNGYIPMANATWKESTP